MPHYVASDLGLHCLPMTLLRVSRQEWVKGNNLLVGVQVLYFQSQRSIEKGGKTENCRVAFPDSVPITLWSLRPGPGCSKLMTSLVNVSLKFQTSISDLSQYFLLKKCEKLLQSKTS